VAERPAARRRPADDNQIEHPAALAEHADARRLVLDPARAQSRRAGVRRNGQPVVAHKGVELFAQAPGAGFLLLLELLFSAGQGGDAAFEADRNRAGQRRPHAQSLDVAVELLRHQ